VIGRTLLGFACSAGLVALGLGLGGCLGESTLDFHICGDPVVPGDIDAVRMSVLDQDMRERHAAVLELVDPDTGDVLDSLPLTASIPSGIGLGWARIEALKDGVETIVFARRVADLEAQGTVSMPLNLLCQGVLTCPLGQTCMENENGEGECQLAPSANDPPGC